MKVVVRGTGGYDDFYQKLIAGFDFVSVQGIFCMESILENGPVDLVRLGGADGTVKGMVRAAGGC